VRRSRQLLATCLTLALLAVTATTALATEPPVEGPIVRGTVVDPDGQPTTAFAATLHQIDSMSEAQYEATFEVVDGAFEFVAQPWGTSVAPSVVRILILLEPTVTETNEEGCLSSTDVLAWGSLDIIAGEDPAPLALTAAVVEGGVCAAPTTSPSDEGTNAAAPTAAGPLPTLPPTDIAAVEAPSGSAATVAVLILLALALSWALAAGRRGQRR
jgi:hypothetical protein